MAVPRLTLVVLISKHGLTAQTFPAIHPLNDLAHFAAYFIQFENAGVQVG
jgi:uncharacterized membrane-anchored protein